MSKPIASKVYDLYGRFYDGFEWLFRKRLARAVEGLPLRDGDHLLDVGIGTGISLTFYPPTVRVTGVDISAGMLRQAERKLDAGQVRGDCERERTKLLQADALNLPFPDASFDAIVLSHVIATVNDPGRCLCEAIRVAREGATVALVNHFRSEWPVLNWLETAIDPICRRLGWRTDLSLADVLNPAGVDLADGYAGEGAIFRIVYLQKHRGMVRIVQRNLTPKLAPSESTF